MASRFGGVARFDGGHSDSFDGKGKGKGRFPAGGDQRWGSGGAGAASLEPAWQVHDRRRRRVARAILEAAAARGVPHDDDEGEMSEDNGETKRWWSRPPPPSKGKGGGKDGWQGRGGYQVSSTRVHVSNLPRDINEGNLEHLFSQHGAVLGLQLLANHGRNIGLCGIVRFSSNQDAQASIDALHNRHEVRSGDGPIVVKLAKPNKRWDQ